MNEMDKDVSDLNEIDKELKVVTMICKLCVSNE